MTGNIGRGEKEQKVRVTARKKILKALRGCLQCMDKLGYFFSLRTDQKLNLKLTIFSTEISLDFEQHSLTYFGGFLLPDFSDIKQSEPHRLSVYIGPHTLQWENEPTLTTYSGQTRRELQPNFTYSI